MPNDLLTLLQAADLAGYKNTASLRHAIRRGTLTAEKLGRDWFVTRGDLDAYVRQRVSHKRDGRLIE